MPEQPQLLIIAGPNRAGKSTLSKDFAPQPAFIFDPDKETARIEKRYPDLPAASIHYALNQYFLDCAITAIQNRSDFVLETNFRDSGLLDTVARFRGSGYLVNMVFLVLSSVLESLDRVEQRVSNGGHFVDQQSIRYNYTEGIKNLQYFADQFDNLEVIDTSGLPSQMRSLLSIQQKQLIFLAEDLPNSIAQEIIAIAQQYNGNSKGRGDDEDWSLYQGPGR